MCSKSPKLDSSYPDAQCKIPIYQYSPYSKDRNKNESCKISQDFFTVQLPLKQAY